MLALLPNIIIKPITPLQSEPPTKAVKCCQLKEVRPTRPIEDNTSLSKIAFVIKIQPVEEYILHAQNKHQVLLRKVIFRRPSAELLSISCCDDLKLITADSEWI